MSSPAVNVLSPEGVVGQLPAESLLTAAGRGFKIMNPANGQYEQPVAVTDDKGNGGFLPMSQVNGAVKTKGFKVGTPSAIKAESAGSGIMSTIANLWDKANTPIGDLISQPGTTKRVLLGALGQAIGEPALSPEDLQYQPNKTDSPLKAGVKTFVGGAVNDAADMASGFTSPTSLALLGAGAASKAVKAGGTLAKALKGVQAGAGMAFGAQGAHEVSNALSDESAPAAERLKQGLTGAATLAGGTAGAGESYAGSPVESAVDALVKKPAMAIGRGTKAIAQNTKTAIAPLDSLNPQELITKATKPRNSINNFPDKLQTALPDAKRSAVASGTNVQTVDDAINAVTDAKKDIWSEYQSRLGPNANLSVSGDPVAAKLQGRLDGMTGIAKKQNPGLVQQIENLRDAYQGQQIPLSDIENRIQELNNELGSIQAKTKVSKTDAMRDPGNAFKFDELHTLQDSLNSELDNITGPGTAELKQRYGNLKSLEDVLYRRKNVADRAAPSTLNEQISRARSAGNIVKGVGKTLTMQPSGLADIAGGVADYAAARAGKQLNNSNLLIQKAFEKTNPSPPPQPYVPPPMPAFLRNAINASSKQLPSGQYAAPPSSYQTFQDIITGKNSPRQLNPAEIRGIDARVREARPSTLEQILKQRQLQLNKQPTIGPSRQLPAKGAIPLGPSGTTGATDIEPVGLPFLRGNSISTPEGEAVAKAVAKKAARGGPSGQRFQPQVGDNAGMDLPKTLYHGTDSQFDDFSLSQSGKNSRAFPQGKDVGVFLSEDPEFARGYGRYTKETTANIQRPYSMSKEAFESALNTIGGKALKEKLQSQGYDAISLEPKKEKLGRFEVTSPRNFVVFDPSKVKVVRTVDKKF